MNELAETINARTSDMRAEFSKLANASPALEAAQKAVRGINQQQIDEMLTLKPHYFGLSLYDRT